MGDDCTTVLTIIIIIIDPYSGDCKKQLRTETRFGYIYIYIYFERFTIILLELLEGPVRFHDTYTAICGKQIN